MATRDWVYYALLEAIVRGQLKPGAWLSEASLATQLEVSRTPLREALQRLQSDLLIERGQNGKLYVRGLSSKEARDLYAVRLSLEELTVEEAAANMTDAKLATLGVSRERRLQAVREHEEIYEALHKGDVESAKLAMRRHIENGRETVLVALETSREHESTTEANRNES